MYCFIITISHSFLLIRSVSKDMQLVWNNLMITGFITLEQILKKYIYNLSYQIHQCNFSSVIVDLDSEMQNMKDSLFETKEGSRGFPLIAEPGITSLLAHSIYSFILSVLRADGKP